MVWACAPALARHSASNAAVGSMAPRGAIRAAGSVRSRWKMGLDMVDLSITKNGMHLSAAQNTNKSYYLIKVIHLIVINYLHKSILNGIEIYFYTLCNERLPAIAIKKPLAPLHRVQAAFKTREAWCQPVIPSSTGSSRPCSHHPCPCSAARTGIRTAGGCGRARRWHRSRSGFQGPCSWCSTGPARPANPSWR